MFGEKERGIFERLELDYPAVAIKFMRNRPEGIEQTEEKKQLCAFLTQAQQENKAFYISVENEVCMGKVALGMEGLETPQGGIHACGNMGCALGAFRSPSANARLYYKAPRLLESSVNFVVFCPVAQCDFDPDIVVCVADTSKADILLRASSYISGDIWESACSYVFSCAWTYVYPYISGKVNHLFTGMHLGLKKLGAYPAGLHIIAIPYQKLGEMMEALSEMEWDLTCLKDDEESLANEKEMGEFMGKAAADINFPVPVGGYTIKRTEN